MNRVLFKTIAITLVMFMVSTVSQALEAEYKNSLNKIELTKTNESSYNVNLYTSKKFTEPVKVIKKSDLSYYILLPETKNSTSTSAYNSEDIRNINTKSYQYAGADVNNGYTKIDINTTKPINFNLVLKDSTKSANTNSQIASNNTKTSTKTDTNNNSKVQKKNLDFQKSTEKPIVSAKAATKTTINKTIQKTTKKDTVKPKQKTTTPIKTNRTIQQSQKNEVKTKTVQQPQKNKIKTVENNSNKIEQPKAKPVVEVDKPIEQDIVQNEQIQPSNDIIEPQVQQLKETENIITEENEEIVEPEKDFYDYFLIAKNKLSSIKRKLITTKQKISYKLNDYGLNIRDIILMLLAGIASFTFMLVVLTRKTPQARLKNKADLFDKNDKPKLTPKKQEEIKPQPNNGQYFIFDKNIRQTGFCDPATSAIKKNYELSSYEPDLKNNYKRADVEPYGNIKGATKTESEYDIIQKILKEDSFIEIAPDEIEKPQKKEIKTAVTSPIIKEELKPQLQKEEQVKEPTVLSSVEIAPERGFMCVSYNDNINLMGYIFDDVFALHNFKAPKLENYDIKFRLTEKDSKTATFMVKVDKTKVVVKVTKSYMQQEVVM